MNNPIGPKPTKIDKPPMLPPKKIPPDPDYEVIDFSSQQYSNAQPVKNGSKYRSDKYIAMDNFSLVSYFFFAMCV